MFSHCLDAKVRACHPDCLLFNTDQTFDNFELFHVAVKMPQMPDFQYGMV